MIRSSFTRPRLYAAALAVWVVMFAIAFANGALRKLVLEPWLAEGARPVSGILAIILLSTVAALFSRKARPRMGEALVIGAVWFALTLAVELILILAAGEHSSELADAFTFAAIARGDLFAPLLLWIAAVPVAMALAGAKSRQ
jgi:membrane-associated HD superfamily phosphohydrolase